MTAVPSMIEIPSNRHMSSPGPSFSSGENVGLFLLAGVSAVSATAIVGLLSYIAVSRTPLAPMLSSIDQADFSKVQRRLHTSGFIQKMENRRPHGGLLP